MVSQTTIKHRESKTGQTMPQDNATSCVAVQIQTVRWSLSR